MHIKSEYELEYMCIYMDVMLLQFFELLHYSHHLEKVLIIQSLKYTLENNSFFLPQIHKSILK